MTRTLFPRRTRGGAVFAACAVGMLGLACGGAGAGEAGGGFLERLIHEMMDPEGLATISKATRYGLASSADPSGKGRNVDRYVSKDENGRAVLADLKGPGCVRRMYFSGALKLGKNDFLGKPRKLQFFFDGEKKPRLETTIQTLAKDIAESKWRSWRKRDAMVGRYRLSPLAGAAGGGYYCYLPVPYERSLKIVLDVSELRGFSYQIGYHRYAEKPEGLRSYDKKRLTQALRRPAGQELLGRTNDPEVSPITGFRLRESPRGEAPLKSLAPGASLEKTLRGPGIIRELDIHWTRGDLAPVRGLVLRAYWDAEKDPSIEVPVDDLFGFDHGNTIKVRLYLLDREDGKAGAHRGRLWLPMPFAKRAKLVLTNENGPDGGALPVSLKVRYKRLRKLEPRFAYFHARWTRSPKQEGRTRPHTMLAVQGAGRLIGCMLAVNKARSGRRYLRAAETLSLDGASYTGTSMENFFNGFFSYRRRFSAAFHGVPIQRKGNVTQFRFFIPDSIPFFKNFSLRFPYVGEDFASVAFWYQKEPHQKFAALQAPAERTQFFRRFKIPGALEAETRIKTLRVSRGRYSLLQPMSMEDEEGDWSGDKQMLFKTERPDWFIISVPVEKEGDYEIVIHMTQGEEYTPFGVFSFLNKPVGNPRAVKPKLLKITGPDGKPHEVYNAKAEDLKPLRVSLGVHHLKPGGCKLGFANGKTMSRRDRGAPTCIGLDAFELLPKGGGK